MIGRTGIPACPGGKLAREDYSECRKGRQKCLSCLPDLKQINSGKFPAAACAGQK